MIYFEQVIDYPSGEEEENESRVGTMAVPLGVTATAISVDGR